MDAAGAHGHTPSDQQQEAINAAKDILKNDFRDQDTQIDELTVNVDNSLMPGHARSYTIAETPGLNQTSTKLIVLGPQFMDGQHQDELVAEIYAEYEHAVLGMNECNAEKDWQNFLQKKGWQNRSPMRNWHHGKGF
jgi:hypothetical protein